jgi:hypothetical protein
MLKLTFKPNSTMIKEKKKQVSLPKEKSKKQVYFPAKRNNASVFYFVKIKSMFYWRY